MSPIEQLRVTKEERLSPELREQILALGPAATPALVEILEDEELADGEGPAQGWPPIHAAELLVDLGDPAAIEPLIDMLVETEFDTVIHDKLLQRLPAFGAAALEPVLARVEQVEGDAAESLVHVLAQLGVEDSRIFDAIKREFDADPGSGARDFAIYGDARALPLVEDAIARFEPDFSRPYWRMDLNELIEAHENLGGSLSDELAAKVKGFEAAWERHRALATGRVAGRKVGRNDPCPCGSGKKYKKCCIDKVAPVTSPADVEAAADDFVEFARPLLDATNGSKKAVNDALALAQFFWDLASTKEPSEREATLTAFLREAPAADRADVEATARAMIERYERMFPGQNEA